MFLALVGVATAALPTRPSDDLASIVDDEKGEEGVTEKVEQNDCHDDGRARVRRGWFKAATVVLMAEMK